MHIIHTHLVAEIGDNLEEIIIRKVFELMDRTLVIERTGGELKKITRPQFDEMKQRFEQI
jgi:hypothetical protein